MPTELVRGCGYRKVGGLYLIGTGVVISCDRLPYNLPPACPTCGCGIKHHRGFQWINPKALFGNHQDQKKANCTDDVLCPMCNPADEPAGLMWVGNKFYTPQSFVAEAIKQGISKRIAHIPHGLVIGETLIYLAHRKAGLLKIKEKTSLNVDVEKNQSCPAIFYVFKPTRIEKLIWKSDATPELLADLKKQNITPVIISDDDKKHNPSQSFSHDIKQAKIPKYKNLKDVI